MPDNPGPYYPRFSPIGPDFTVPPPPIKPVKPPRGVKTAAVASPVAGDPTAPDPPPVVANLFVPVAAVSVMPDMNADPPSTAFSPAAPVQLATTSGDQALDPGVTPPVLPGLVEISGVPKLDGPSAGVA
jgi:hypothetical protein